MRGQERRQVLLRLLQQTCAEEARQLTDMGIVPNFENTLLLSQVKKAAKGDAAAVKYLRELLEEPEQGPEPELSALSDRELLAALAAADE